MAKNVTLTLDCSPMMEILSGLSIRMKKDLSEEVIKPFLGLPDFLSKLGTINSSPASEGTIFCSFEPSEFLADLLSTPRAVDFEIKIREFVILHGGFISSVNTKIGHGGRNERHCSDSPCSAQRTLNQSNL